MKEIWILNHYATNQFREHGGRHYYFAKYLKQAGYHIKVFCASTVHNSSINLISDDRLFIEDICDGIPFVFLKVRDYQGNGKQRILNMLDYYRGIMKIAHQFERPDVIIGSSVHPLACVAAIRLGKRFGCKAIVEIRDLWPESIVAYKIANKNNPVIQFLYYLERWIYKKAHAIIFTMEGGRDYIVEQRWDKEHGGPIDLAKVYHINNGVDLEAFDYNKQNNVFSDPDLDDPTTFKVVYTGSIRLVNQVEKLVEVAKSLRDLGDSRIKILIWGKGDQQNIIQERIEAETLTNIVIKGAVPKEDVPYILSKSDLNVYILLKNPLYKYGLSTNKAFEYFAAGKPVLASGGSGYSIIDRYGCGKCMDHFTPEGMAEEIIRFFKMSAAEFGQYGKRARQVAHDYDFKILNEKLISIIENT